MNLSKWGGWICWGEQGVGRAANPTVTLQAWPTLFGYYFDNVKLPEGWTCWGEISESERDCWVSQQQGQWSPPGTVDGAVKPTAAILVHYEAIVKLFNLCITGVGARNTAKHLNELGYRKVRKKKTLRAKRGKFREFSPRDIIHIVTNPIYAGFVSWGRKSNLFIWRIMSGNLFKERICRLSL